MKIFLLLAIIVMSCNSNTKQSTKSGDSTSHHAHSGDTSGIDNKHILAMHNAMNNMMEQIRAIKPTGDDDYDFAMMMKVHHEAAVTMAQAEVADGSDAHIKSMAQKMIDDQQREITEFDRFMNAHSPSGRSDYGVKAQAMMTEMTMDMNAHKSSIDKAFVAMMTDHHQDGIDMAKEFLKSGKDTSLRKIANDIIVSQQKEIGEMVKWGG